MAKFTYQAETKTGTVVSGVISGAGRFEVAKTLRQQDLLPIKVKEYRTEFSTSNLFPFLETVSLEEKIMFCRNLAGMLTAGLSLYRALEVLKKQSTKKKLTDVLTALLEEIDKGGTLSAGMEKFPKVFGALFVAMVKAGEESGSLPKTLKDIGESLEKMYTLTRKIKGALMYPAVILCLIFVAGILMFIFVVPTITQMFKEFNTELPASTQVIVWFSDTISTHPILIILGILALAGFFVWFFRLKFMGPIMDYVILHLPMIGTIAKQVNAARTTRTLSSLLSSGVPVTNAFAITHDVLQNVYYKRLIQGAIGDVEKGQPISASFKSRPDLYPVMVGEMIEVGEETGRLADMLSDIATFYETEVDQKTKDMSTIIEPLLMIMIGAAVGFFAVAMLSPMYSLVETIK
jgi:type IV pilus assembly protein PilC